VLCLAVTPITVVASEHQPGELFVWLGGVLLSSAAWERLARLDTAGLWGGDALAAFFKDSYGLPFEGELICW
jgi:hypothetical protein